MKLLSESFEHEEMIPEIYTCKGKNISPELHWDEVPPNVKSFCLIMEDPDAPAGNWIHWILVNISFMTRSIKENSIPQDSIVGFNSWKKTTYGGPCPPSGIHRYFFRIYALDKILDNKNYSKAELEIAIKSHVVDDAILMGKFKK